MALSTPRHRQGHVPHAIGNSEKMKKIQLKCNLLESVDDLEAGQALTGLVYGVPSCLKSPAAAIRPNLPASRQLCDASLDVSLFSSPADADRADMHTLTHT